MNNPDSYLQKTGYSKSIYKNEPLDENRNPVPWMNYSIVELLTQRLDKYFNIFEYGLGYSTLYFANLVNNIIAIEYNKEWFDNINQKLTSFSEINLVHIPINMNYNTAIENINLRVKNLN